MDGLPQKEEKGHENTMKVTFDTKQLDAAVSAAAKIVNTHTTVPILTTVLLTADNNGVTVRSTDVEITLERRIGGAVVHEPGTVAVTARVFADYLSKLPRNTVDIETSEQTVILTAGRAKVTLNTFRADEFPVPPEQNGTFEVVVPSSSFKSGVESVSFAASTEEARGAVLMGTVFQISDRRVRLVATDGYRLSTQSLAVSEGSDESRQVVVPTRALQEVSRNLGNSENVRITLVGKNNNQTRFETEHSVITVRNVDGQYPNWKSVVPEKYERSFKIDLAELKSALNRITVIAKADRSNNLALTVSADTLRITANSDASGSADETIETTGWTGEDLTVNFNGTYLLDGVNHVETDDVLINLNGALAPAKLEATGDVENTDHFVILMPLRT